MTRARVLGAPLALAAALSAGCGSGGVQTHPALAPRCFSVGGDRELALKIAAPAQGLLRVTLELRGIAAVAEFSGPDAAASRAASPIERLGTITLVREVAARDSVALRVASVDSPDLKGRVCAAAEVIAPTRSALGAAARQLASAGTSSERRDWQSAFGSYLAAARLLDGLHRPGEAARARHAMAQLAYGRLQRKRDAVALAAQTLAAPADPASRGARLTLLATALIELPPDARPAQPTPQALLDAAASAFRRAPEGARELPRLAIVRGFELYQNGRLPQARDRFESAAADCGTLHDWQCFARARMNLAALAEEQQDYTYALASYEQALQPLDRARMPQIAGDIYDNLGRLESRIGLFSRSAQSQKAAIALYARIHDCDGVRRGASSLGAMLVNVGSLGEAQSYLDAAMTLDCRELLATLEPAMGAGAPAAPSAPPTPPASAARNVCARPLAVSGLTEEGMTSLFGALMARGNMAQLDGDLRSADTCLAAARGYAREARTEVWLATAAGALHLAEGRAAAARAEYQRGLRLADELGLSPLSEFRGTAELGLAQSALLTGDSATARERAYAALNLSAEHADVGQIVGALRLLASAARASRDDGGALTMLRLAVKLMERVPTDDLDAEQRATYLATQHEVFSELTDVLIADARPAPDGIPTAGSLWDAFAASEQGRARSLRYALGQTRSGGPPRAQAGDYRGLLRRIADAVRAGSTSSGAATEQRLIEDLSLLPVATASAAEPPDTEALRRVLAASGSTLIEYAVGHDETFAFVVEARQIRVVRLASQEAIAAAAVTLLERLREAEPDAAQIRTAADELARLVWWPISAYVTGHRVVIVPDDALNTVPFALLPWAAGSETPEQLLLQRSEVSTLPAAMLLLAGAAGRRPGGTAAERFVLLGDPVFRSTIWRRDCANGQPSSPALQAAFDSDRLLPSLPGTAAEVQAVATLVRATRPAAHVETLLHCAATAAGLREQSLDAQLLHVATHGLVDARRPRLSSLALTPNAAHPEEAAFRLLDIVSLPLRARLVVLSACDTSRGRLLAGEGVLGLAQAFLQAGADSVVASYWRVADGTTAPFMRRFYRYLLEEHLPVAAALRRAQLDEVSAGGDPYAWAAFGLYGRADSAL